MNIQSGKLKSGEPFIGEFPEKFKPELGRKGTVKILDPYNVAPVPIPGTTNVRINLMPIIIGMPPKDERSFIEIDMKDVMYWTPVTSPVLQAYCNATNRTCILMPELVLKKGKI